jgi:hypothetical protein
VTEDNRRAGAPRAVVEVDVTETTELEEDALLTLMLSDTTVTPSWRTWSPPVARVREAKVATPSPRKLNTVASSVLAEIKSKSGALYFLGYNFGLNCDSSGLNCDTVDT